MAHKLEAFHFPWNVFFRANDISRWVEAGLGSSRSGDQPGDDCAFLAVLVLQETSKLGVADQSRHINNGDYVTHLEVSPFIKQCLGSDRRGHGGRGFGAALFENGPAALAFRAVGFCSGRLLEFRALGAGALSEGERAGGSISAAGCFAGGWVGRWWFGGAGIAEDFVFLGFSPHGGRSCFAQRAFWF